MLITTTYDNLKDAVKGKKFPLAICDIDAFNSNLKKVGDYLRKAKKSLRLCTKSVRVPELIKRVEEEDFVNGLFTYNSAETLFFAEKYQIKDILLGYPTTSSLDAEELCKAASIEGVQITAMVDSTHHLDLLEKASSKYNVNLDILIEVDVADVLFGTNVGVYRSPLRKPEEVVKIAKEIGSRKHLRYRGIMGYEAQNASIGDKSAFMRWVKKRSRKNVNQWRQNIVDSLIKEGFEPEVVNGGGSGCFQETASESTITEIGIGSLLFKSHIFDDITSLNEFIPSLFFVLQVVRKPRENLVTTFSGGYVSSGAVRALPIPIKPEELRTIKNEEFGEVQTPFKFNPKKTTLKLGDPVLCRFGKAGEPLEHFNEINIYSDGRIIDQFSTYRGMRKRFS